jgi:hypothetical protein
VRKLLATIAIVTLATVGAIGAAGIVGAGVDQVCPDLDTGHLTPDDPNATSVTITAPEGQVIVQVCSKAGSAEQGLGPEFFNFDPGVTTITLSHSSGKEISHFSVKFAPAPPPTTAAAPPTTAAAPPTTAAAPGAPTAPAAPAARAPAAVAAAPRVTG